MNAKRRRIQGTTDLRAVITADTERAIYTERGRTDMERTDERQDRISQMPAWARPPILLRRPDTNTTY